MNKLAVMFGVVLLLCEGCAPIHPPIPVAPPPPQVVVVPPKAGIIDMPQAAITHSAATPAPASIAVYPGSLKENIERIAAHYGWRQVVWDAPQDFKWVGHAQIQGDSLASVLRQLLDDFPLQAVFYHGNHVLYIHPRTLR
jgi:hypothetical protein